MATDGDVVNLSDYLLKNKRSHFISTKLETGTTK
jgi:hypothetical protein